MDGTQLSCAYRPFFCNVTSRVFANPGWKTMESHNANQKQIATVCNNGKKSFKHSVDFVKNKTTNYGRYYIY